MKKIIYTVIAFVATLYLTLMFFLPLWNGGVKGMIQVLKEWQTLNSALIALLASLVALYATQFNVKKQKERDFIAAKAFLPNALSEIAFYLKSSAKVYKEIYANKFGNSNLLEIKLMSDPELPELPELPEHPENYKQIFRDCIHSGQTKESVYLSKFLIELQVHDTRMRSVYSEFLDDFEGFKGEEYMKSNILNLAELYTLLCRLFPFGRNEEPLNDTSLKYYELENTLKVLDIKESDIKGIYDMAYNYSNNSDFH